MMRPVGLAFAAIAGLTSPAYATFNATASLFSPTLLPGTTTSLQLRGINPLPSQSSIDGSGYSISFTGTASDQGVVQGPSFSIYAIPVAGHSGSDPMFLTGGYGSALTMDATKSGEYLSTGKAGQIAIVFGGQQHSFTLLWGSIDASNALDFYKGARRLATVTGTQVQELAAGFISDGFQGPGGSAYVTVGSTVPFDKVVARSDVISFEFAGAVASGSMIDVPEPASLGLLSAGLLGLGLCGVRRRG